MAVRARRHQRGWRLVDLAAAAGVGATACSLLERGLSGQLSVRVTRAIAGAVDLPLMWDIGWQRQEVDRLLDADHSALAAYLAQRLGRLGWTVRSEVSFNQYGDRGRIDLVAFHPVTRTLLIIEIKTAIVDAQAMLGALDVKARVGRAVARQLGWEARRVVPALVILDGSTARRHVRALEPLLTRFDLRGRRAVDWLRQPDVPVNGLLFLTKFPSNAGSDVRRAGRRRVRVPGANPRSRNATQRPRSAGHGG
jgi:transcriptional regulator with XRE-family HTH domain